MSTTQYKIERALDQIRHTLPSKLNNRLVSSVGDINPIIISIDDSIDNVMCVVPVCVEDIVGYYCVNVHKVFLEVHNTGNKATSQLMHSIYSWDVLSPTGFECLGGKGGNRKWRFSIRIITEDQRAGRTLGQWLKDHDLEDLVPKSLASSPDKKTRKSDSCMRGSKSTKYNAPEVRKSPIKKKSSPVKRKSPKKAGLKGSPDLHSEKQLFDVHADTSFSFESFKPFLPVVTSGTPVINSKLEASSEVLDVGGNTSQSRDTHEGGHLILGDQDYWYSYTQMDSYNDINRSIEDGEEGLFALHESLGKYFGV